MYSVKLLQKQLKKDRIDAYIVDTADPHGSEYINDYYKLRSFFSGFNGSNGTLIVMQDKAYLWTDGRYFIQAANELYKGISLMKMGEKNVPTILQFLEQNIKNGFNVAFDGQLISGSLGSSIEEVCKKRKANLISNVNYADIFWVDRPEDSQNKIFILDKEYCGESSLSKLKKVRKNIIKENCEYYFNAKLDDIMWLFNIRGNDIECNPVAYSFLILGKKDGYIFLKKKAVTKEVKQYFSDLSITICDYSEILKSLTKFSGSKFLYDARSTMFSYLKILNENSLSKNRPSYIEELKAVKNKTEIKNIKDIYIKDSVAVTKFIKYIKDNKNNNISECRAASYLDKLRAKIPGFIELSFPTISAYGANAAMMHYEPDPNNETIIKGEGIYLVDSGGQYLSGTTDVTRSIVLGDLSDRIKEYYTRTAIGMLRLMNLTFFKGCTGRNIDIVCRQPLWEIGSDYKCGTGHGIGYCLNVHEGPQNISFHRRKGIEATLMPGMIISDEPGVYKKDEFGIRIENILLIIKANSTADGDFLKFEPLTYVPLDTEGIDTKYMNEDDIKLYNKYQSMVYKKISPYLNSEERAWLKLQTNKLT